MATDKILKTYDWDINDMAIYWRQVMIKTLMITENKTMMTTGDQDWYITKALVTSDDQDIDNNQDSEVSWQGIDDNQDSD